MPSNPKPILYIVVNNHFDLTWRRCWQRQFTDRGRTFISYTDLEAYYLEDNIALAEANPEYKFEAETVQVVRKAVERSPKLLPILQRLAREGRFAVTGGGEAIVDANMITGESLLRNYVDGLLWVEANFGQKTRLAVRNDAFGNSAQLPQILRGVEIAWATGMSYSPAEGLYWRGLDGSAILHRSLPIADRAGGVVKYPPCSTCLGSGQVNQAVCPVCGGRGIDPHLRANLPETLPSQAFDALGAAIVMVAPEELLPNPALLQWAAQMRQQYDVRFALEEDVLPLVQPWLDELEHPAAESLHPDVELNPNNSGCLVTRIRTKQEVRRQEYALFAAEALSVMANLGGPAYNKAALQRIREDQYFSMFHDAITATHIDAAYDELLDIYASIDDATAALRSTALARLVRPATPGASAPQGAISVINASGQPVTALCTTQVETLPAGFLDAQGRHLPVLDARRLDNGGYAVDFLAPAVPAFTALTLQPIPGGVEPAPQPTPSAPQTAAIQNSRFRIQADAHGLTSVFDKVLNREIVTSGVYRPAELVLEHDEGSPWATLSDDQRRASLSGYTQLTAVDIREGLQRLTFTLHAPRELGFAGSALDATLEVSLVEGLDQVRFNLHVDWHAFNHRLRVAMPVPVQADARHIYEIPYGMLTRQPYTPTFRWAGANGDWPAVNWAGVEQPGLSVALFNQGTPSYRIEPSGATHTILLSVLRAPCIPTYLHEPEYYSMTAYDGMRDEGAHDFAFAVGAYAEPFTHSAVVLDGEAYNAGLLVTPGEALLPAMPALVSDCSRLAALKWAEAGDGLVLRLVEYRGAGGEALVRLPFPVKAAEQVNLLERQGRPLEIRDQAVRLSLRPWEIATLKLTL